MKNKFRVKQSEIVAGNIKRLRRQNGMKQADLAKATRMSIGTIRSAEQGVNYPRPETVDAIADAFGIDASEIVSGEQSVSMSKPSLPDLGYIVDALRFYADQLEKRTER